MDKRYDGGLGTRLGSHEILASQWHQPVTSSRFSTRSDAQLTAKYGSEGQFTQFFKILIDLNLTQGCLEHTIQWYPPVSATKPVEWGLKI